MLRRNISPAIGLVNGATGTLLSIVQDDGGEPFQLRIKFDNIEKEQVIEKVRI